MAPIAILYLCTLVVMLPLDLLFLGFIAKPMFEAQVGDMLAPSPRLAAAVLFYLLYIAGVLVFVNAAAPGNWQHNAVYGGLFGLFCYATFELTNMAMLRHWSWAVVAPDIGWGIAVTAFAAAAGGLLAQWVTARIG